MQVEAWVLPVLVLLVLSTVILYAQSYPLTTTYVKVFEDGSVEVLMLAYVPEPPKRVAIDLLAQPLFVEAFSDGQLLPVEVQGSTAYIVVTGTNLTIRYITTELTSKEGGYWDLRLRCTSETLVILPKNAYVLEVVPENFSLALVNGSVALVFPQDTNVLIRYFLLPELLATRTSTATPFTQMQGTSSPITATGAETTKSTELQLPREAITVLAFVLAAGGTGLVLMKRRGSAPAHLADIGHAGLDDRDEAIIRALASGPRTAQEIMVRTGIPKTPLYRRLKKLERMGLVETFTRGGKTFYKLRRSDETSHQQ